MNRSHPADLPKARTPEERQERVEMASKLTSEFNNPCIKEQKLSYKCLSQNNYDREICSAQFANYIACQKFWQRVRKDRQRQGISPELPHPEDRGKIKAEYIEKWKFDL